MNNATMEQVMTTENPQITSMLEQIARDTAGIRTLETRKSDRLDFHEIAVWDLKEMLTKAFDAGRRYEVCSTLQEAVKAQPASKPVFGEPSVNKSGAPVKEKKAKGPKVIELRGLKTKERSRGGHLYGGEVLAHMNADVINGKSIRIFGTLYGKPYDHTFEVGGPAVSDSFNKIYLGTITQVTENSVTIKPNYQNRTMRLDLVTFTNRNYDFDLERINKHNAEWTD